MQDDNPDAGPAKPKTSNVFLYSVMLGMLLTGSANTLIQKYQNDTISKGNYFTHPYFQTAIMFAGELSVFIAYGVKKYWIKRQVAADPEKAKILLSPGTQKAGEKQLKMNQHLELGLRSNIVNDLSRRFTFIED